MSLKNSAGTLLLLAATFTILTTGCGSDGVPKAKFQSGYFDVAHFITQQQAQLGKTSKAVEKTAFLNGKTEHKEITIKDSAAWAMELAPFMDADINKPAFVKRYSTDSISQSDSMFIVDYKALDTRLRCRELKLYYKGKAATSPYKVDAFLKSDKIFYESSQFITYTIYGEYEVLGKQDVVFAQPDSFAIHARFLPF